MPNVGYTRGAGWIFTDLSDVSPLDRIDRILDRIRIVYHRGLVQEQMAPVLPVMSMQGLGKTCMLRAYGYLRHRLL